jgi:hypothetical protein
MYYGRAYSYNQENYHVFTGTYAAFNDEFRELSLYFSDVGIMNYLPDTVKWIPKCTTTVGYDGEIDNPEA